MVVDAWSGAARSGRPAILGWNSIQGPSARTGLPIESGCVFEWHVPADQLTAEVVRRTRTRRAIRATRPRKAALVGQERDIAHVLRRVAVPTVTRAIAVEPVLAGTLRGR